jgi:hypothetical protein
MDPWFDGTETDPAKFSPFVKRYVHFVTGKESHRVIVLNHVKPKSAYKFLVHILLSMGRFSTGENKYPSCLICETQDEIR